MQATVRNFGREQRSFLTLLLLVFFVGMGRVSWGQTQVPLTVTPTNITTLGAAVTQNFNGLASSGVTSTTVPAGWAFAENGTNGEGTYTVGIGSSTTGDTYSFGSSGNSDRAFGSLASGTLQSIIGGYFKNTTGSTITSLAIAFTSEQWRFGATGRGADRMEFAYSTTATNVYAPSGYTSVTQLNALSTVTTGTVGALDGNSSSNRTAVTYTITGLSIANNGTFWIRWTDFDITGADDGLGIDDLSLTASGATSLTPPTLIATASPTSVDNNFTVTYSTNAAFTTAIGTGNITISNGTTTNTLTANTDYTLSGNNTIIFTPSISGSILLHTPGTYTISVNATGYSAATVTQVLTVGAAAKLSVITQPTAPAINGAVLATQPAVAIQDKYGNATTSTASVTATSSQSTWTAGGTTTITASSGIASFTNLTASSAAAVAGATITFASGALTSVVSSSFNIPAPIIDYISLTATNTPVTQNFDGMGTAATTSTSSPIPTGFKANIKTSSQGTPTWSDGASFNLTSTTASGGTAGSIATGLLNSFSAGGTYNFANGLMTSATDRSLGYITSTNYPINNNPIPTSNTGVSILSKVRNLTGSTLSQATVIFDYEKYRSGLSAASWSFYYSTDGNTWTVVSNGNQTYAADVDNNTPFNPPSTINKSVTITGLALPVGSSLYFRWSDASGGTNAQAIGIDNFSITACQLLDAQIASAPSAVCFGSGAGINVSSTSGGTLTYTTQVGTGTPLTHTAALTANGTITLNDRVESPTTFTLVSVASANGCSNTVTGTATVNVNPLPTVAAITGPPNVAVGGTITLKDATLGGIWSIDASGAANLGATTNTAAFATASIGGNAVGTSVVSYTTAADGNGCTNTANFSVNVYNATLSNYRSKANGNFTNVSTWEVFVNGNWEDATTAPGNNNNITIRDSVTLNTDFSGNVSSSLVINTPGKLTITPNHYFNSTGAVNFNGNLVTVQSDATGTGAIGFITNGSAVSGATNVTVERYIPKKRAWRLITSPITTATINAAWQEGDLWDSTTETRPAANHLGTLITGYAQGTGTNANAHGYDFWGAIANSNSSIRYYVPAATSGTWTSLSTISNVKISDYSAYMLFVRGDRSVTYDTGYTVLRANGTLQQADNIPFTVDRTKAFTVVGNPYASSVDFEKIYTASTGVKDRFWVWNSSLGNYGAYSLIQRNSANNYSVVPSPFTGTGTVTPNAQFIQSSEGFLVQPLSTATNGTITIGESAKSPSQTAFVSTFRLVPDTDKKLWVNLNLANGTAPATLADGVMMRFDASYDTAITDDDAQKAANFNENLGITRSGIDLTTEARADVATSDTVMLKLWNVTMRSYQLQVMAANWAGAPATHAFIEDNYLKTKQEVNLSGGITTIDFSVTNDAASAASDRFRVVFQNDAVLPVTLTKINAVAGNAGVNISWTVTNEVNIKQYTVERSTDGGRTYTAVASTPARNGGSAISSYSQIDAQPAIGDNLYRIRIETAEGNLSYSPVVKVTVAETSSGVQITLYPNPINKNGKLNLQLNNVAPGSYLASVYSEDGKRIYGKKIVIAQANVVQSETVNLGSALAQGSYRVMISDNKGKTVFTDKILVQR